MNASADASSLSARRMNILTLRDRGPVFLDTWHLVINTATTLITPFMVFPIQHRQNGDSKVIHLKFDELIKQYTALGTQLSI